MVGSRVSRPWRRVIEAVEEVRVHKGVGVKVMELEVVGVVVRVMVWDMTGLW